MDEQIPIRPGGAWVFQDRDQTAAVELEALGNLNPGQLRQGRENIDVSRELPGVHTALEPARPRYEERDARTTLVRRRFAAAHAGVTHRDARGAAVVGDENDQRVLLQA